MEAQEFVFYTLALLLGCIIIGILLSIAPLHIKSLSKYRIQDKKIQPNSFYKRLPLIVINTVILFILSGVGLYFLFPIFNTSMNTHIASAIIQVLIIMILDDLYFYFYHKWLHDNKKMLKSIHSIHHRATAPLAMDYLYVHPLEWLIGFIGPFIGILSIAFFTEVSIWGFWSYQLIRTLHEIDVHSGFKSILSNWIPFWGETEHHDMHHEVPNGNYASTFTIWDQLFGTKM